MSQGIPPRIQLPAVSVDRVYLLVAGYQYQTVGHEGVKYIDYDYVKMCKARAGMLAAKSGSSGKSLYISASLCSGRGGRVVFSPTPTVSDHDTKGLGVLEVREPVEAKGMVDFIRQVLGLEPNFSMTPHKKGAK